MTSEEILTPRPCYGYRVAFPALQLSVVNSGCSDGCSDLLVTYRSAVFDSHLIIDSDRNLTPAPFPDQTPLPHWLNRSYSGWIDVLKHQQPCSQAVEEIALFVVLACESQSGS